MGGRRSAGRRSAGRRSAFLRRRFGHTSELLESDRGRSEAQEGPPAPPRHRNVEGRAARRRVRILQWLTPVGPPGIAGMVPYVCITAAVATVLALFISSGLPMTTERSAPNTSEDVDCANGQGIHGVPTKDDGWVLAAPGCFPYLVSIRNSLGAGHACSGFLVGDRLVATAAHCLAKLHQNPVVVIEPHGRSKVVRSQRIIFHPEWSEHRVNDGYDFGILVLSQRVQVATPALADPAIEVYPGYSLNVFWWEEELKMGHFTVVDQKHCFHEEGWDDGLMCIYSGSCEAHQGLSGAPVVLLWDEWNANRGEVAKRLPELDLVVGIILVRGIGTNETSIAMASIGKSDSRNWILEIENGLESSQILRGEVLRKISSAMLFATASIWGLIIVTLRAYPRVFEFWLLAVAIAVSMVTTALLLYFLAPYITSVWTNAHLATLQEDWRWMEQDTTGIKFVTVIVAVVGASWVFICLGICRRQVPEPSEGRREMMESRSESAGGVQLAEQATARAEFLTGVEHEFLGARRSREPAAAIPVEDDGDNHSQIIPDEQQHQLILQQEWEMAAALVGEEQESLEGNELREPVSAVLGEDADDRHSQISLDEVQHQLMGLRYNLNIMGFLKEQMENAQTLAQQVSLSEAASLQLGCALSQGDRLIKKHSQVFNIRRFYKIEDAVEAVQLVCGTMHEALVQHGSQIVFTIPRQRIDRDRQHLYAHLGYVLVGKHCDFGADGFQEEWESLRRWHEVQMRDLNIILDRDLVVGQRRGTGGFSQVHEGQWRRVSVAVKKTTSNNDAAELPLEQFTEVFKEASMHALLNHPHIIRYYGMTKAGWIVMELADGDFSALNTDRSLPWPTIHHVLKQAAFALEYVHSREDPLIHGDIKDRNFLYKKSGSGEYDVKLADFGLTTEVRNWQTNTVRKATATPLWKAPELFEDGNPSHESDVFSFGLVMYALVTGLVPYGLGTNEFAMMLKKLRGEQPCIVEPHHCPGKLHELMGRCVARDPGSRPTMSEVAEWLSKLPTDWQAGQ